MDRVVFAIRERPIETVIDTFGWGIIIAAFITGWVVTP